jgi:hypothetical protein
MSHEVQLYPIASNSPAATLPSPPRLGISLPHRPTRPTGHAPDTATLQKSVLSGHFHGPTTDFQPTSRCGLLTSILCEAVGRAETCPRSRLVAFPPWPGRGLPGQRVAVDQSERRGWTRRVHVASGGGWVITEQVRTVSADRFRRYAPEMTLSTDELGEVRHVLPEC